MNNKISKKNKESSNPGNIFLTIIIPCYNEKENLERGVLDEVYGFLKRQKFNWQMIISDDGSTDGSTALIKKKLEHKNELSLLINPHGGKPVAVWEGIKNAKGEFVLITDMDQSTPIFEIKKILPFLEDYDIVIGSRGLERKNFSLTRKIGSAAFRNFRKLILLKRINDTQCGFKVFKTEVARKIFPKLQFFNQKEAVKGWRVTSFDVELLFLAEKYGYKIKEVPVEWEDRDVSTGKERSYLKESKEMLEQILRVKINDLKGKYNQ